MLIERVKRLCGGEIPENVNGRFFQIAHGTTGYVFVKTSIISEEFQDVIDCPGNYDYDNYIGRYKVLRGIYLDFNGKMREITDDDELWVQLNEEIEDLEDIEDLKNGMDECLDEEIKRINKLKLWINVSNK